MLWPLIFANEFTAVGSNTVFRQLFRVIRSLSCWDAKPGVERFAASMGLGNRISTPGLALIYDLVCDELQLSQVTVSYASINANSASQTWISQPQTIVDVVFIGGRLNAVVLIVSGRGHAAVIPNHLNIHLQSPTCTT